MSKSDDISEPLLETLHEIGGRMSAEFVLITAAEGQVTTGGAGVGGVPVDRAISLVRQALTRLEWSRDLIQAAQDQGKGTATIHIECTPLTQQEVLGKMKAAAEAACAGTDFGIITMVFDQAKQETLTSTNLTNGSVAAILAQLTASFRKRAAIDRWEEALVPKEQA